MTSSLLISSSPSLKSSLLPSLQPLLYRARLHNKLNLRRLRNGSCRAEFANDAPFAVAIGACIFSSFAFPTVYTEDDDGDAVIDSADARFAVMGIISFIPYFNWMSWVFAWLDTGKQRYAVYALVYLAPYLRTNLSLSPEDSWLPIASILLCIFHIQLEASIKNGDFQALTGKRLPSIDRKKDGKFSEEVSTTRALILDDLEVFHSHLIFQIGLKEEMDDHKNLPSSQEESRDEIRRWKISRRPSKNPEHLNEDGEDLSGRKH